MTATQLEFPHTRILDHYDSYNSYCRGKIKVKDPYVWLEEPTTDTATWLDAQTKLTSDFLERHRERVSLRRNMYSYYNYPSVRFQYIID